MNEEVVPASFRFEKLRIPEFSFHESNSNNSKLNLKFIPSGVYSPNDGRFELKLLFIGFEEKEENYIVKVSLLAGFKFENNTPFEKIPEYFYKNSIAIVFPYIRSFVSSLTLQANVRMVSIGLLNLSSLEETLKKNTEVIENNATATELPSAPMQ